MVAPLEMRQQLLAAQSDFLAAARELRVVLEQLESEVRLGRAHIDNDGHAAELPMIAGTPTVNPQLNLCIDALEDARQRTRYASFSMASHEGLTHADIGKAWGISRQLVSRIMSRPPD